MILIKGSEVRLEMDDGRWVLPPESYGIIHDPEGQQFCPCVVYVGPYTQTRQQIPLTKAAKDYFGPDYVGRAAKVDVPEGPWDSLGNAVQIRYFRPGTHKGKYFHFFEERTIVLLAKCENHYRIELPEGCVVNWRGFVAP